MACMWTKEKSVDCQVNEVDVWMESCCTAYVSMMKSWMVKVLQYDGQRQKAV